MNSFKHAVLYALLPAALLAALAACGGGGPDAPSVKTDQFVVMAKTSTCTENRNRLYVIDDKNVFWDTAGNCPYSSPVYKLFGTTPGDMLCSYIGKPGGAITICNDNSMRDTFSTITSNIGKADFGLGTAHKVQEIPF